MDLLERLTQTPAIAGREHRLRDLILNETKGLFDETRIDPLGSLICVRHARPAKSRTQSKSRAKPNKPLKVMIGAHMDQIGFAVRHIDSNGFVRVQSVGGFDTRNLFARLVTLCTPTPATSPVCSTLPADLSISLRMKTERKCPTSANS